MELVCPGKVREVDADRGEAPIGQHDEAITLTRSRSLDPYERLTGGTDTR